MILRVIIMCLIIAKVLMQVCLCYRLGNEIASLKLPTYNS